jgi:hypothetical protein
LASAVLAIGNRARRKRDRFNLARLGTKGRPGAKNGDGLRLALIQQREIVLSQIPELDPGRPEGRTGIKIIGKRRLHSGWPDPLVADDDFNFHQASFRVKNGRIR